MPRARVAPRPRSLSDRLLVWFDEEARDLPWRRTRDPYAILVSEIMLQQTRVETVIPYYERFLRTYPTVAALARASIDDVLKLWEGLGYYRRAHNLHGAARVIVALHGGRVPEDRASLRALPGIGPYTAAAVASIAFGGDEPVLDGNVIRVVSRLFRVEGDAARAATRRVLEERARSLVPAGRSGAFNEALMDLGARVCLARAPRCADCPVAGDCAARRDGDPTRFPERAARRPVPHRDVVAGVIWERAAGSGRRGRKLLLAQREAGDMLGGLWEFPGGTVEAGETLEGALARELREELGIKVDSFEPLVTVEHAYTHFRMSLHVFHCRHAGGRPRAIACADFAWILPREIERYALSTADRRVARALLASNDAG